MCWRILQKNIEMYGQKIHTGRGWSAVDMHGAWHPIPFDEHGDGMVGYKFDVTWVCSAKEPIRIKFCEENRLGVLGDQFLALITIRM
jgi:hypothetical protein